MTKYKLNVPTVYKVTHENDIEYLAEVAADMKNEGYGPSPTEDRFLPNMYYVNDYCFYESVKGDFWASRLSMKAIKNEMLKSIILKF